jgi:hypothetical protein
MGWRLKLLTGVKNRLRRSARALLGHPVTDGLPEEIFRDPKWQILNMIMRSIRSWELPPGDYLEFGVYRGLSFKHAYELAGRYDLAFMKFYAFDSFEGLPAEISSSERKYDHFFEGQYSCSENEFRSILETAGVDLERVTTVPGFYDRTLTDELKTRLSIDRAAVVWIDCDLYSSTVPVLEFVTDYLATGSFLVFDDWFSFGADPGAGEMRATMEWQERHPEITLVEYHKFHSAGISFLIQRSD